LLGLSFKFFSWGRTGLSWVLHQFLSIGSAVVRVVGLHGDSKVFSKTWVGSDLR